MGTDSGDVRETTPEFLSVSAGTAGSPAKPARKAKEAFYASIQGG